MEKKLPLMVLVHGGVHGNLDSSYIHMLRELLEQGYAVFPVERRDLLDGVRRRVFEAAAAVPGWEKLGKLSPGEFFDSIHRHVPVAQLNGFRVKLIDAVNRDRALRPDFFAMARRHVGWIAGNELAMQRTLNLSIQYPSDDSSLLPLHSDVWAGNSPYEVVLWVPLVDCYRTKSMYVLPRRHSEKIFREFPRYSSFNAEELYKTIKPKLTWLDVPYGQAVLFTHSLLHGNRVNAEASCRWTFNIRFKGLLTPYGVKELGESFLPITVRPATRIGFECQSHPGMSTGADGSAPASPSSGRGPARKGAAARGRR